MVWVMLVMVIIVTMTGWQWQCPCYPGVLCGVGGVCGGDNDWVAMAVPPQVVTLPRESVRAVPGQTVTFTCVATGVPTPIITWRLNWGHTPSSHRWAGPGAGSKGYRFRIRGRGAACHGRNL